jgi:hypothetical protein
MDAISITGCWEGTLLSDQGGAALPFSLQQPPRSLTPVSATQLRVGGESASAARLLDGATRAIVALLDDTRDPGSGRLAQLIVEARVRGDGLVGWWLRRDSEDGHVLGSGTLSAVRTA